jgi:hypothetical protein
MPPISSRACPAIVYDNFHFIRTALPCPGAAPSTRIVCVMPSAWFGASVSADCGSSRSVKDCRTLSQRTVHQGWRKGELTFDAATCSVTADTGEAVPLEMALLISMASGWPGGREYVHEMRSGAVVSSDVGAVETGSADAKSHSSSAGDVATRSAVRGVCAGLAARVLAGRMDCWYWNGEAWRDDSDLAMLAKGSSRGAGCGACGGELYAGGAALRDKGRALGWGFWNRLVI